MSTEPKASFTIEGDVKNIRPRRHRRWLGEYDWLRGEPVRLDLVLTNHSPKRFPGGTLSVEFSEHGTGLSANQLRWNITSGLTIGPLEPEGTHKETMAFLPLLTGLCSVGLQFVKVDDPNIKPDAVLMTGFRAPPRQKVQFYFYAVDAQLVKLGEKITELIRDQGANDDNKE